MKLPQFARRGWLFAFVLCSAAPLRSGSLANFFTRVPDMVTVTDVTEEGRTWPVPEPGEPVYYEAVSFGAKNFPGLPGDPAPNSHAMLLTLVKVLAKQGYLQARQKGEAKIFLSIGWGYSRASLSALSFLGGDKLDLMWELESGPGYFANALRRGMRGVTESKVMDAANSNLYIASIQAFDLEKLDAGKQVLLWHTRIACPANGLTMASTLPTMLVAAGPFIGRETKTPVWRDATELKNANVEAGEAQLLEFIGPGTKSAETPGKK